MSPKYRQRGYQDSAYANRDREPSRTPPPQDNLTSEERIQRRSLRRATTREAHEVLRCHSCGRNSQNFGTIVADSVCPHCRTPLHCCRTCVHFDTAARWQCRAEIAMAISAKSEANACPQYQPRLVLDATGRRSEPATSFRASSNDPKAQFENLFKR